MQNEEVAVPETPPDVHVSIIISTYTCSTDEGIFFASVGMGVGIHFIVGGGGGGGDSKFIFSLPSISMYVMWL